MNKSILHLFIEIAACGRMFECYFSKELTLRENLMLLYEMLIEEYPDLKMPDDSLCIYDSLTYQIIDSDILCGNLNLPQFIRIVIC